MFFKVCQFEVKNCNQSLMRLLIIDHCLFFLRKNHLSVECKFLNEINSLFIPGLFHVILNINLFNAFLFSKYA